jgi:cephalosporin hydroxylase
LSGEEAQLVCQFHNLYYGRYHRGAGDTINLSWFGYEVVKCPLDLWIYQELIVRTRPDFIIETGTWCGGSALYFAMLLDWIGHGSVISVDIAPKPKLPQHRRITYITGSSVNLRTIAEVRARVDGLRAMVILDSDHSEEHVHSELTAYSPFVQVGD